MGIIRMLIYGGIGIWLVIVFFWMIFWMISKQLGLTGAEKRAFGMAYPFLLFAYWFVAKKAVNAFKSITT